MSAFSSAALPGVIKAHGGGAGISPRDLFSDYSMMSHFGVKAGEPTSLLADAIDGKGVTARAKVEIFDLSSDKERREYEKLWGRLFVMASRGEACVDTRKDLVNRADGTSYWMRYVEYVVFERDSKAKDGKAEGR